MQNIYLKMYERELEMKSKYLNQLEKEGYAKDAVVRNIENDLVDIMVFCKVMVDKIRKQKKDLINI